MIEPIEFPSPHFSDRHNLISAIVIHDTGGKTALGTLRWFAHPDSKVSSHYVVGKDGIVYRCIQDDKVAWHAGVSELWGVKNVNDFSLGIEVVDDNDEDIYPDIQLGSLIELCVELITTYKILLNRIVGHQHICIPQGRKVDPGKDFPWYEFLTTVGSNVATKELTL